MLFGVNVVIVSHEKIPFNFGASKEIWDSLRSKICELGIWKIGISFVNLMSSFICQIEVWGVLIVSVKFGIVCTSGQLLNMWTWHSHKSGIAKEILGHKWFLLYVWCVMGMEVLNMGFNGLLWTRTMKHGRSILKGEIRETLFLDTFNHLMCYAEWKNLSRFHWWCLGLLEKIAKDKWIYVIVLWWIDLLGTLCMPLFFITIQWLEGLWRNWSSLIK